MRPTLPLKPFKTPPVAADAGTIRIGKTLAPREADGTGGVMEVFTMTLGQETIELLPLKTWSQLDVFKWRARGILPSTPIGLQITPDSVKVAGETASVSEPDGCARLEKALNLWLVLERDKIRSAAQKQRQPAAATVHTEPVTAMRFALDLSAPGQPRIRFIEGNVVVKTVALNLTGLNSLIQEGVMKQPRSLKVGALHDWVELDGEVFRLKEGEPGAAELEKTLNERFLAAFASEATQDVWVFANPASPTGFDIQFAATPAGLVENKRRHLDAAAIELLQDPQRCRVLRKDIVARFAPPDLIFKLKTPDGGERHLDAGPASEVHVGEADGVTKVIDLSRPVSLLTVGVTELNAIFSHPAVNRRAQIAALANGGSKAQ